MALSDDLSRRIGKYTKKGTKITQAHVDQARAIESENVIIAQNNTRIIANAINQATMRALEAVGLEVQRIASDNAPVDTGRLAASITHALDPDEPAVYIGTNVEVYPIIQELGSSKQSAANGGRGYLRPAVNDNVARINAIFNAEFTNA
jgi:hypothetical protein